MDRVTSEVVILGTGPVGLALGCLLAQAGMECVVAEREQSAPAIRRVDPRALALTPAARAILDRCGAWPHLAAKSIGQFRRMEVWDAAGSGRIEFDSADLCASTLGYIVNQGDLEVALRTALTGHGTTPRFVTDLAALEFSPGHATAHFADGAAITGALLVGADGARSRVRELAGIGFASRPYAQHALACTVRTALPHGATARQRFLADGPLAFLPLADTHACGVVWSTTPEHARRLQMQDAAAFRAELAAAFEHVLGAVEAVAARVVFPLQRAQAERYCRAHLVLVGDAAHCVHPLAGQGANLGLLDAAGLAQLLLEARAAGRNPSALRTLRAYERWRRGENGLMIAAMDGLQKLFGATAPALRHLRNAGLDLCDALTPVKHRLMSRAMGLSGDLPDAARVSLPGAGLG